MQWEYVEIKTDQDIFLNGFYASKGNKSCAIFIPGVSGCFIENKFARVLAQDCVKNNIDFLFAHNQGSFQIIKLPCLKEEDKLSSKMLGAAYEHFDDCIYDLDAWFRFVSGYENLYVIAHSLGCNKLLHYLQKHKISNLKKIVLLAPEDLANFINIPEHSGMLTEAETNLAANQPDKILSKKFLGYCVISSQTYYDFVNNKNINNIPYKTPHGDMSALKNIDCPLFAVIGAKEDERATEYMQKIADVVKYGKSAVIPDANHVFKNQEKILSLTVMEFLIN